MAVKKPIANFVCIKFDDRGGHRGNIDGMFKWSVVSLAVDNTEKMPVQMHGMMHLGPVVET